MLNIEFNEFKNILDSAHNIISDIIAKPEFNEISNEAYTSLIYELRSKLEPINEKLKTIDVFIYAEVRVDFENGRYIVNPQVVNSFRDCIPEDCDDYFELLQDSSNTKISRETTVTYLDISPCLREVFIGNRLITVGDIIDDVETNGKLLAELEQRHIRELFDKLNSLDLDIKREYLYDRSRFKELVIPESIRSAFIESRPDAQTIYEFIKFISSMNTVYYGVTKTEFNLSCDNLNEFLNTNLFTQLKKPIFAGDTPIYKSKYGDITETYQREIKRHINNISQMENVDTGAVLLLISVFSPDLNDDLDNYYKFVNMFKFRDVDDMIFTVNSFVEESIKELFNPLNRNRIRLMMKYYYGIGCDDRIHSDVDVYKKLCKEGIPVQNNSNKRYYLLHKICDVIVDKYKDILGISPDRVYADFKMQTTECNERNSFGEDNLDDIYELHLDRITYLTLIHSTNIRTIGDLMKCLNSGNVLSLERIGEKREQYIRTAVNKYFGIDIY